MSRIQEKDLPRIKIVGIGGGGCSIINHMLEAPVPGVEYLTINTGQDARSLSKAAMKLQIGQEITHGHGAGGDAEIGRMAAEESRLQIADAVGSCDVLVLVTCLGRGTGTGATPVIAEIARKQRIFTIAVVTTPFGFEGTTQATRADTGLEELKPSVDLLSIVPNNHYIQYITNANITLSNAFALTDDVLEELVKNMVYLTQKTVARKETQFSLKKWMLGKCKKVTKT